MPITDMIYLGENANPNARGEGHCIQVFVGEETDGLEMSLESRSA